MKKKVNKVRQQEIDEHIFNYVKSLTPLTPFKPNPESNTIYDKLINLKNIKHNEQLKRQSIMSLSSRVYDMSLGSPLKKKEKRVKFADDVRKEEGRGSKKRDSEASKSKIGDGEQLVSNVYNEIVDYCPAEIQKDL